MRLDERAVVGRDDNRRSLVVDGLEQLHELVGPLGVEVAGRLVGEHEVGLHDEGARDRDPLLLAAGKLVRVGLDAMLQAHLLEGKVGAALLLLAPGCA